MIEQLFFMVISLALFVYIFFRMIRNNDNSYIAILILEAIGIAINFIQAIFALELNILVIIIKYILAMIIPILVLVLERKNLILSEVIKFNLVKFYLAIGNNKMAKQILQNMIEKETNNYKAHRMLAEIYEQEGGMRKAIDEYVIAIDINKQDYDSYYKVAELLKQLDKKDEASEMLFNLLNIKPETLKATELLGEILLEKQMYKEAVNIYQSALRYNPLSYEIQYNLGIAYTMLNDFQNAKECYEMAAQINALSFMTKYSLAEIALIYKEIDEAEKNFLESLEEDELAADAYYELSKISLLKNDKETAIKYINTAIDIDAKKIVSKVKKDDIFIPIIAKISMPFNLENDQDEEKKQKLSEREIIAKEHLEQMSEITRNLSYNDINLLKQNEEKERKNKEVDLDDYHREYTE